MTNYFRAKVKWAFKNITAGHSQLWHLNACAEGLKKKQFLHNYNYMNNNVKLISNN
jgi:hypothetical protein